MMKQNKGGNVLGAKNNIQVRQCYTNYESREIATNLKIATTMW